MNKLHTVLSVAMLAFAPAHAQTAVTTYHYDTLRSGWNSTETTLTAANAASIQLQQSINVDSQIDAQPLLVPGVNLGSAGTHDVLYVVTENDTVYGIDAESGAVLLKRNLGSPTPDPRLGRNRETRHRSYAVWHRRRAPGRRRCRPPRRRSRRRAPRRP